MSDTEPSGLHWQAAGEGKEGGRINGRREGGIEEEKMESWREE
jgi:hypothetical protein